LPKTKHFLPVPPDEEHDECRDYVGYCDMDEEERTLDISNSQYREGIAILRSNVLEVVGHIDRDEDGTTHESDG